MLGRKIFYITISFVLFLWVLYFADELCLFDKHLFSTRQNNGIFSILTGPFLHLNLKHIVNNTKVLLITLPLIQYFYKKDFIKLSLLGIVLPNVLVYVLGLAVIGISGLVYTYIWFLIFAGMGSKDKFRFACSIVFMLFYCGTLVGATPLVGFGISWRAHLFGLLVALFYSIYRYLRK